MSKVFDSKNLFIFPVTLIFFSIKEKNKNPHLSADDVDIAKEFIGQVQVKEDNFYL